MRILFYIIIALLVFACVVLVFLYLDYRSDLSLPRGSFFAIERMDGKYKIKLREEEKESLKSFFNKMLDMVYYEATIHNPSGDVVPDSLDDTLIRSIRDRVK